MKKICLAVAMCFTFGFISSAQAVSLLTPIKTKSTSAQEEEKVSTLPVQFTETPRNFNNARIQLPQQGENIGVFTRKTTVYDARNSFSIVYDWKTVVTTNDEQPYMGVLEAPIKKSHAAVPKPRVEDANFLGSFFLETEENITFSPSATARFPLPDQQKNNDGITVYFYNEDIGGYTQVEYTPSRTGSGVMIPVEHNGYYAIYDRPGTVPTGTNSSNLLRKKISAAVNRDKTFIVSNTFADIEGHWAETYVKKLDDMGIAPGKNSLLFAPDEAATRADVIKMVVNKKFEQEEINTCLETHLPSQYVNVFFHDISQFHPYAKYICMAAVHKVSKGLNNGAFDADRPVSRAEALKLLYTAIDTEITEQEEENPFGDVSDEEWFTPYIIQASKNNVAKGFPITKKTSEAVTSGIKKGNVGIGIKNAKQALLDLNFYAGKANTIFDNGFQTAVVQYQLAKGIIKTPVDLGAGVIGPKTAELMNNESGRSNTSKTSMIFKPHAHVTRAELSKFASLIFGL